eukprot:Gb_02883 [translate_table: standard]
MYSFAVSIFFGVFHNLSISGVPFNAFWHSSAVVISSAYFFSVVVLLPLDTHEGSHSSVLFPAVIVEGSIKHVQESLSFNSETACFQSTISPFYVFYLPHQIAPHEGQDLEHSKCLHLCTFVHTSYLLASIPSQIQVLVCEFKHISNLGEGYKHVLYDMHVMVIVFDGISLGGFKKRNRGRHEPPQCPSKPPLIAKSLMTEVARAKSAQDFFFDSNHVMYKGIFNSVGMFVAICHEKIKIEEASNTTISAHDEKERILSDKTYHCDKPLVEDEEDLPEELNCYGAIKLTTDDEFPDMTPWLEEQNAVVECTFFKRAIESVIQLLQIEVQQEQRMIQPVIQSHQLKNQPVFSHPEWCIAQSPQFSSAFHQALRYTNTHESCSPSAGKYSNKRTQSDLYLEKCIFTEGLTLDEDTATYLSLLQKNGVNRQEKKPVSFLPFGLSHSPLPPAVKIPLQESFLRLQYGSCEDLLYACIEFYLMHCSKVSPICIEIYDELGIGGGASGVAGGLLHPYSPKAATISDGNHEHCVASVTFLHYIYKETDFAGKLLWNGAECWQEALKLLTVAETEADAELPYEGICTPNKQHTYVGPLVWRRFGYQLNR